MKVVINKCYGGFGLSPKATEAYAKRKGIDKLYWFETRYRGAGGIEYIPVDTPDRDKIFVQAYTTPDHQEGTGFWPHDIDRGDPDLVAAVEDLGSAAASGGHANLEIIEIPDDIEYVIQEYDGREWVAEAHRTWS